MAGNQDTRFKKQGKIFGCMNLMKKCLQALSSVTPLNMTPGWNKKVFSLKNTFTINTWARTA